MGFLCAVWLCFADGSAGAAESGSGSPGKYVSQSPVSTLPAGESGKILPLRGGEDSSKSVGVKKDGVTKKKVASKDVAEVFGQDGSGSAVAGPIGVVTENLGKAVKAQKMQRVVVDTKKRWQHRRRAYPYIEGSLYDSSDNNHLPDFYGVEDYYRYAFDLARNNDISGLSAIIAELKSLGKELPFILEELRTGSGDNLLISAVRSGAIDVVRYLLSLGSDVVIENGKGETPLSIAVDTLQVDMINAISEMKVGFDISEER